MYLYCFAGAVGGGVDSLPPVSSAYMVSASQVAGNCTSTVGSVTSLGELLSGLRELCGLCYWDR